MLISLEVFFDFLKVVDSIYIYGYNSFCIKFIENYLVLIYSTDVNQYFYKLGFYGFNLGFKSLILDLNKTKVLLNGFLGNKYIKLLISINRVFFMCKNVCVCLPVSCLTIRCIKLNCFDFNNYVIISCRKLYDLIKLLLDIFGVSNLFYFNLVVYRGQLKCFSVDDCSNLFYFCKVISSNNFSVKLSSDILVFLYTILKLNYISKIVLGFSTFTFYVNMYFFYFISRAVFNIDSFVSSLSYSKCTVSFVLNCSHLYDALFSIKSLITKYNNLIDFNITKQLLLVMFGDLYGVFYSRRIFYVFIFGFEIDCFVFTLKFNLYFLFKFIKLFRYKFVQICFYKCIGSLILIPFMSAIRFLIKSHY